MSALAMVWTYDLIKGVIWNIFWALALLIIIYHVAKDISE